MNFVGHLYNDMDVSDGESNKFRDNTVDCSSILLRC